MKRLLAVLFFTTGAAITIYGIFFIVEASIRATRPGGIAGVGIFMGIMIVAVGSLLLLFARKLSAPGSSK
ncbi:MAG TPA: hypothetical protein VLH84_02040 [Patescibacteria group bacterium]|nr:hypothetical protein [Patescibacteria group bacterium]